MLSSTSLLHANCVFNRNNTVATQQGMKTYWLCKSYRISMCRARCITHQGRVISATGVHNHPPHMRVPSIGGPDMLPPGNQATNASLQSSSSSIGNSNSVSNLMPMQSSSGSSGLNSTIPNLRLPQGQTSAMLSQHSIGTINDAQQQNQSQQLHQHHPQQQQQQPAPPPPPPQLHQQHSNPSQSLSLHHQLPPNVVHHPSIHQNNGAGPSSLHSHQQHGLHGATHGPPAHSQSSVIQNMMHNVNLMHLSNIGPMLNPLPPPSSALAHQHSPQLAGSIVHHQQHSHQLHHQQHHPPSSLEITPILPHSPDITSPTNRNSQSHGTNINSPMATATATSSGGGAGGSGVPLESPTHTSDGNSSSVNMTADCNSTSVPNSAVSPSNVTGASSNCHSVSQDSHNSSQHSHIISSITISPSTAHNFKIEDM